MSGCKHSHLEYDGKQCRMCRQERAVTAERAAVVAWLRTITWQGTSSAPFNVGGALADMVEDGVHIKVKS